MILVFLLLILIILLTITKVRIDVNYIRIIKKPESNDIKLDFLIKIQLLIANKIKYAGISINKRKIKPLKKIVKYNPKNNSTSKLLKKMKKIDYNIDKFNLSLHIGTEDAILTSMLIAMISTFIGIFIGNHTKKYNPKKHFFVVTPIYSNKNTIDLDFSCIIVFDLIHIIKMLILNRKNNKKIIKIGQNNYNGLFNKRYG